MSNITLRGMTWDHPRGYEPLAACAALWQSRTGVRIHWDRRSLQDFESFPVEELARQYDLIVIDHPHVGQVTREDCLLPFDPARLASIARGTVGRSFDSYLWQGRQWALPIDAATQVQAWRPGRLESAAADWAQVLELARAGRVALPMRAPHSLMCLYTLCAQRGAPAREAGPELFDPETATAVCEQLGELLRLVDPRCLEMDPIAVFEAMAQPDSSIDCVPLIYGYVNYAWAGFRPVRLGFADIPSFEGRGPVGSALGGTGIAVSARTAHAKEAFDFAIWVADAEAQRGPFAAAGGQSGHAAAWEDDAVNATAGNFYRATRATLEGAWVRPRHDGYMLFQHAASLRLNAGLQAGEPARAIVQALNAMYRESLA
ncbi:extracellular solute-binding protein [Xenophilus arseniciresistens]|uniref:Extracellular solute-binding protein n=1 Tax=Xenophilus arseniciresistens TaxID=1283306 RepID=A0AAE3N7P6_9BURK|nr:extracellular solute-binding protein [Xenophilus arseniciresistens]MDA7416098.1 extracellular solute-binding protein [Xenophilus arseniciresistens]